MTDTLIRDARTTFCDCLDHGEVVRTPLDKIYEDLSIDGIIRIHAKDYLEFPSGPLFTHFNLEFSGHKQGKVYALPKIVTPGFYISPKNKRAPVLNFSNCFIVRCLKTKERVPYADLTKTDFQYSLRHIQNSDQLKKEILWRYTQSLPNISPDEILQRGVSITTVEILKSSQ